MIRNPHELTGTAGRRPGYNSRREDFIGKSSSHMGRPGGVPINIGANRMGRTVPGTIPFGEGNTNREQGIMNQYTRPRGDVYTGGQAGTDKMAALMGGMDRNDNAGIMQMAYRPGSYGTDYDYDDYGPFIPPSVLEMDEFGGEYDPGEDEYNFDLLRGNLPPIGQSMAELTQDQMNMMGNPLNTPDFGVSKEDLWNRTKGMEDQGFFGWGAQEPTTQEEYVDYYNKLLQGEVGNWVT